MVELSESERVELLAMLNSTTVSARVATRARIVLWRAEGWLKKDVASRAGVSRPTVDAVLKCFAADGAAGARCAGFFASDRERFGSDILDGGEAAGLEIARGQGVQAVERKQV